MTLDELPGNCGISVIVGLGPKPTAKEFIEAALSERAWLNAGMYAFSDITKKKKSWNLAEDLCDLGDVFETRTVKNPNSKNKIVLWVWQPDRESVYSFCQANKIHFIAYEDRAASAQVKKMQCMCEDCTADIYGNDYIDPEGWKKHK